MSIKTGKIDTVNLFGDQSNTFYVINELDTLLKPLHSSDVFIKIDGTCKSIGAVDFGCESK